MMINSVSHNAPSRLTTTAETDQLTWFCTFLRVARIERSRQGPVCKHQRKRRTSIKRGNGSPAPPPPQQRNPSRLLRQKRNTRKRKKSTNAQQHIWQIWQSQNCLYAKLGETTVKWQYTLQTYSPAGQLLLPLTCFFLRFLHDELLPRSESCIPSSPKYSSRSPIGQAFRTFWNISVFQRHHSTCVSIRAMSLKFLLTVKHMIER